MWEGRIPRTKTLRPVTGITSLSSGSRSTPWQDGTRRRPWSEHSRPPRRRSATHSQLLETSKKTLSWPLLLLKNTDQLTFFLIVVVTAYGQCIRPFLCGSNLRELQELVDSEKISPEPVLRRRYLKRKNAVFLNIKTARKTRYSTLSLKARKSTIGHYSPV